MAPFCRAIANGDRRGLVRLLHPSEGKTQDGDLLMVTVLKREDMTFQQRSASGVRQGGGNEPLHVSMPMPSTCKKAAMPSSRSSGPENRCKVCTRSSPSTHASVHTAGDLPASGACASGTSDSHERRTGDSCTCSQYSRMCMQFTAATSVKVRCRHQTPWATPCGNRRPPVCTLVHGHHELGRTLPSHIV